MTGLTKMRTQDLIQALMTYCASEDDDTENRAWLAWNAAWEQADEMLRRDALMITGVYLHQARKQLTEELNK